jgi:hypothetical protein
MIASILEDFTLGQWAVLGVLFLLVLVFLVAGLAPRGERESSAD